MLHLQSAPASLEHINGKIKIEPCIGTFNKLQTKPLKAAMTALSNIATAPGVFKHSGQNLTIQKKDSIDHMLWVALGHLYGCYSGDIDMRMEMELGFDEWALDFYNCFSGNHMASLHYHRTEKLTWKCLVLALRHHLLDKRSNGLQGVL